MGNSICVIGAGAAGMMAAGTARSLGAQVTLFEHMPKPGRKLAITGKGRCNVTNHCSIEEFLQNVTKNPKFLYRAITLFPPEETEAFFEGLGVELKTERGNRVYPASDKAYDIVDAMKRHIAGCQYKYEEVKTVEVLSDGRFSVNRRYSFDAVILATGGVSYRMTGSDGSGFALARMLGHSVTPLVPSLIPLESPSPLCPRMQGLSLKNVAIRIYGENGEEIYSDFGEMLFAHFGLTGPMILSASAHLRNRDFSKLDLEIDLKPALDEKTLDARLLSDFKEKANKDFCHALDDLLPSKMIEPFLELLGIDPHKKINAVTKEERRSVLTLLKHFRIPVSGFRPIEEAIVTSGGIPVSEIKPGRMESKLVPGLYFAGEMIDVDAYTGGFNLQIAFATGYLAGKSAAETFMEN